MVRDADRKSVALPNIESPEVLSTIVRSVPCNDITQVRADAELHLLAVDDIEKNHTF
jgi:hypothetical protein